MSIAYNFRRDRQGVVVVAFAIMLVPLLTAVGVSVDYAYAGRVQRQLQDVSDGAVLAAARVYMKTGSEDGLRAAVETFMAANDGKTVAPTLVDDPSVDGAGAEICITLEDSAPTAFLGIVSIDTVDVGAQSCAIIATNQNVEISLVLDVSSSMIENNRFDPMVKAVDEFLKVFQSDQTLNKRTKIAIVPFSSRVSIGMTRTSWLTAPTGASAVPDRWTNPTAHYSSSFKKILWVDGQTPTMYNGKNYYWMGCIEPRSDVEIHTTGKLGTHGLTDSPPATAPFWAMDHNAESSKSFCPPPIVSLSSDFAALRTAVAALTSQGSTRLDAGMTAGWYTLSPKWRGVFADATAPLDYGSKVQKIVVFMTDGQMNVQHGSSSGKLDWLCEFNKTSSCNSVANTHLQTVCTAMKSAGILVFTVSYDGDADLENMRTCATSAAHQYTASKTLTATDYIGTIYTEIAESIRSEMLRLSH